MMLDGKYHEAVMVAYNEWQKNPTSRGWVDLAAGDSPCFWSFREATSVRDYLRTVDFESTEVKVHWTDEHGEWVRRTFTSRPDNVVVQWLTAPKGQSVNVRIRMSGGGGRTRYLEEGRILQEYVAVQEHRVGAQRCQQQPDGLQ